MPYVPDFPGSSQILICVPESVPDAKNVQEIKKNEKEKITQLKSTKLH